MPRNGGEILSINDFSGTGSVRRDPRRTKYEPGMNLEIQGLVLCTIPVTTLRVNPN